MTISETATVTQGASAGLSSRRRRVGLIEVAVSGFFFGLLGPLGKTLYSGGITSGELLASRFLLGSIVLWPYVWVKFPGRWRLPRRQLLACLGLGVLGYAVFSSCFFKALEGVSASMAVLLLYTYPAFVVLGGAVFFGERIPRSKYWAIPLTALGMILLVSGDLQVHQMSSIGFGLAAAVVYSLYILVSNALLRDVEPQISIAYILIAAGVVLGFAHFKSVDRTMEIFSVGWKPLLVITLISTLGAMTLFLAGLQKIKTWEVSFLSTLEPVTGIVLSACFLGERLQMIQLLGAALVLAMLVWIALPGRQSSVRTQN